MEQLRRLIKRDWLYFVAISVIFFFGIWLGELLPELSPETAKELEKVVTERFTEIANLIKDAPLIMKILVIWGNNIAASVTAVLTGIIIIPVLPVSLLIGNGVLIGLFQRLIEVKSGITATQFFLGLIPHGLFELPAFFIAAGLGIRFGLIPYRLIWHYSRTGIRMPYFQDFLREARYYAVLILILLLIAATIEVTISPLII